MSSQAPLSELSQPARRTARWRVLLGLCLLAHAQLSISATRVTLGVVNWIGYGPVYCAAANHAYAKFGLDVRLANFSDNSLMPGALEGGELDASALTYDQVILAAGKGWHLKVVMPLDYSVGGDAIIAGGSVHEVKDLKGHKVAFQPLSASDFLLGFALSQAGLTARDIQPVNSTPEGVVAILATGAADAGVTYQPSVTAILSLADSRHYHIVMSSKEARGIITDVLALKDSLLHANPNVALGLIKGTLDGLEFMRTQPDRAVAIIAKALQISAADVQAQLPNVENPPLSSLDEVFRRTAALPSFYASGPVIGRILSSEHQISRTPAIEETFDSRFVAELQRQSHQDTHAQ